MKIIIGHVNMDLDCFGSMVLARYLYPDYELARSSRLHPSAKNLYNLYKNHMNMKSLHDIKDQEITSLIIVDTASRNRTSEFFKLFQEPDDVIIYDHHNTRGADFPKAQYYSGDTGSNTTLLALECIKRKISLHEKDATIALTGIYADTGNFRHDGVRDDDFTAAAYLMREGASLNLVNKFVEPLKEQHQVEIFHLLNNSLQYKNINGQFLSFTYLEMEKQTGGMAAVVEKLYEIENSDAIFSFFYFKERKETLIVGRSRYDTIAVDSILAGFGGGGHRTAASALVKKHHGMEVFNAFMEHLETKLMPAVLAKDIMTRDVLTIEHNWTLFQASKFLESSGHTGGPVVDDTGKMTGFLTLRDIMKGRKGDNMNAPVYTYMKKDVISCSEFSTLREIEHLMFENNIGHLPVMEKGVLTGIVTRSDYLKWYR
jgi:tRNA nucleotidyltransferase (CCA-adding enzyme)